MPYLTILDYSSLDTRSKNLELRMQEKDKAIQQLKQSDSEKAKQIDELIKRQDQLEAWLRNPEQFIEMRNE
ncbi:MAG TPA: hypothetical protein VE130_08760, partial [Nitrososphaeraceae archaeon]|nr:hypothetical protein [Nitrososphaeraceae archaeon]